jgi:alkanesulfonate monooxygenase SsuD/methylene tetrahydromethanopterin reductase-like flavin-dependent oxidoreductase (luciferase family)
VKDREIRARSSYAGSGTPNHREPETLQQLTGGRFELGVGGGRPGAEHDAEALGRTFGTPAERLDRVAATIRAVRETPGTDAPPILVAASKPRMFRLAAEQADIVALGLSPQASEQDLIRTVAALRQVAGDRRPELHLNVAAVADRADAVPEFLSRMVGGDPRAMAAAGGIAFLLGSPSEIADRLLRRRAELGVSYIGVSGLFMEQFAPVLSLLRDAVHR